MILDGPVVEVLIAGGEVDAEHLARPAVALQDAFDLRPGQARPERHPERAEVRIPVDDGPLDGKVRDAVSPFLQGHVADLRVGSGVDLDHRVGKHAAEVGRDVAVDVGELRALLEDEDGVGEHSQAVPVDVHEGLQGKLDTRARRHIDERAAGAEGAVQAGEPGAGGGDCLMEPGIEKVSVGPGSLVERGEHHALGRLGRIEMGRDHRRVVLDGKAAPLSHLSGGPQEIGLHVVESVGSGLLRDRGEPGEVELPEVGVAPFLGLRGRHRRGLELLESALSEA